jgi:hypothetical protein
MSNLNFTVTIAFSFLEMRSFILGGTVVVTWLTYLTVVLASGAYAVDEIVVRVTLVAVASALSYIAAYARERSRRTRFLVQRHAQREKADCEKLLMKMLPSRMHAKSC